MQIGNNRTGAPQPQDPKKSHLDPDLTKVNRDGIESTSREQAEKTRKGREAAQKKADSFQRSRPQEDVGVDVGERIKNARAQGRVEGARVEDARAQGARVENARGKDTRVEGARVENARESERAEGARESQRVENARASSLSRESVQLSGESQRLASGAELPGVGGSKESKADRAERLEGLRISNARGELNTPERARRAAGRLLGGE